MTEKRFTAVYDDIVDLGSIYDSETERFILVGTLTRTELICNLLNELYDENKELKEGVEELNEICKYYEMRIKELSEQADAVREELRLCEEENTELQKENEQLKSEINMLKTTISRNEAYIQQIKHKGEWK